MNAEIRRATAEDIPHVAALEQELVRGDAPGDPYLVRDLQRQDVEEQYHTLIASDWAVCLVATHQGEVVGYLSGGWKDSPKWRPEGDRDPRPLPPGGIQDSGDRQAAD